MNEKVKSVRLKSLLFAEGGKLNNYTFIFIYNNRYRRWLFKNMEFMRLDIIASTCLIHSSLHSLFLPMSSHYGQGKNPHTTERVKEQNISDQIWKGNAGTVSKSALCFTSSWPNNNIHFSLY